MLRSRRFGWPSIFIVSACFGALLLVLTFLFIKSEWRDARGEKFDGSGSVIYAVSIALFMYGFSSLPSLPAIAFLFAGMIGLVYFVRRELKSSHPILDFRLFKSNRIFLFSNIATLSNYLATYALTYLLSLYLQYIKELTPYNTGIILIWSSIPMVIFTPLAGRLSDRIEPRLVASTGLAIGCVALVLLIFLSNSTPIWYIKLALVLYGTGIGLFSSPNTNAIMGSVDKRMLGVASGTNGTMRTSGMMLSMGITMIIFAVYIGQVEITRQYYPQLLVSARVGFGIFTALGVGGVVAQIAGRRKA